MDEDKKTTGGAVPIDGAAEIGRDLAVISAREYRKLITNNALKKEYWGELNAATDELWALRRYIMGENLMIDGLTQQQVEERSLGLLYLDFDAMLDLGITSRMLRAYALEQRRKRDNNKEDKR